MRASYGLLSIFLAAGCQSKGGIVAKVKDPSRVVLRLGGAGGLEMRGGPGRDERIKVGHYNTYDVIFEKSAGGGLSLFALPPKIFLSGTRMGPFQPPLGKLWKPGKKTFGISSSVKTSFDSRYRDDVATNTRVYEWRRSRLPYSVFTSTSNIEYFEEEDIPDRSTAAAILGVGVGLALAGYYMSTRDSWYVKYPGYVFLASSAFQVTFGAINAVRPKRPTKYTRPDGTETTVRPTAGEPAAGDPTRTPERW